MRKVSCILKKLIIYVLSFRIFRLIPDNLYLKIKFRIKMNKKLDLNNPQSFNEKLQWLKLYDRKPEYTRYVDKYEVRSYIKETIGEEYLIPLLGVYNSFDEIDFENLPNQFVLKCTHDSGGIIICSDKSRFDVNVAEKKINKCLRKNYFYHGREWPYKNIKPKIICEKYMVDESKTELKDYKFFCFDGCPKALYVATDRGHDTRFNFYDINFKPLGIKQHYDNSTKEGFDKMLELSKELSKEIPHIRVDFYDINGEVFFGELTFYHLSGFDKFDPDVYDEIFGSWIQIKKG